MNILPLTLDYLNAGGVLAILLLGAWGFYTGRIRLGKDYDDQEKELQECRDEVKGLWKEKVLDKEEKAELARAYLKIVESNRDT